MSREKTILDDLDLIQSKLYGLYETIVDDEHVKQVQYHLLYPDVHLFFRHIVMMCGISLPDAGLERLALSHPTWRYEEPFFLLFKQGVDYSYKTYGEGSLASGLRLYSQFVDQQNRIVTDHISYDPNVDQIQLSFLHLAGQCAHYSSSGFFTDSHLPNVRLGAQAYTVLQAIEECYHRYQIHHLGYPPVPTTETMKYEQEITSVWQRAISDLNGSPAFKGIQPT